MIFLMNEQKLNFFSQHLNKISGTAAMLQEHVSVIYIENKMELIYFNIEWKISILLF